MYPRTQASAHSGRRSRIAWGSINHRNTSRLSKRAGTSGSLNAPWRNGAAPAGDHGISAWVAALLASGTMCGTSMHGWRLRRLIQEIAQQAALRDRTLMSAPRIPRGHRSPVRISDAALEGAARKAAQCSDDTVAIDSTIRPARERAGRTFSGSEAIPFGEIGQTALRLNRRTLSCRQLKPKSTGHGGPWEVATEPYDSDGGVQLEDFFAYMPMHQYIFAPLRELWPGSSVNSRVMAPDATVKAADWLDKHRAVEQMTWVPGEPMIIEDRLISDGAWIPRSGCACFNLYRAPTIELGDPEQAGPWLRHALNIYPDTSEHIVHWLAHRVQRPAEKINHALVLGGLQGIGKDTLLEPVKHAVGPWNFCEVSPPALLGRFNSFVKSVILRVSEARDLGDVHRNDFYEHLKAYTAAPPDVLRCDEKNIREYSVPNVCGVVLTTNHKSDGIYLPADDRRHFVAWSELTKEDFPPDYFPNLYGWYENEDGYRHVAAYLASLDLSEFDPKAPPPKTTSFWDIVDANRAPEDAEMADALEKLQNPAAVTIADVADAATSDFRDWLLARKNSRGIAHRMEKAGYQKVRNDGQSDGRWKVGGRNQVIYARRELPERDRIAAATRLAERSR